MFSLEALYKKLVESCPGQEHHIDICRAPVTLTDEVGATTVEQHWYITLYVSGVRLFVVDRPHGAVLDEVAQIVSDRLDALRNEKIEVLKQQLALLAG